MKRYLEIPRFEKSNYYYVFKKDLIYLKESGYCELSEKTDKNYLSQRKGVITQFQ